MPVSLAMKTHRIKISYKYTFVSSAGRVHLQCRRPRFDSWVEMNRWRRDRLPTPVFSGFPGGSAGKESTCNVGDLGSIPGLGRSHGEGNSYPLQYSAWRIPWTTVHGVTESDTTERLSLSLFIHLSSIGIQLCLLSNKIRFTTKGSSI